MFWYKTEMLYGYKIEMLALDIAELWKKDLCIQPQLTGIRELFEMSYIESQNVRLWSWLLS